MKYEVEVSDARVSSVMNKVADELLEKLAVDSFSYEKWSGKMGGGAKRLDDGIKRYLDSINIEERISRLIDFKISIMIEEVVKDKIAKKVAKIMGETKIKELIEIKVEETVSRLGVK